MTAPAFVLVASGPIEQLGAEAGDSILVRPGHDEPVVVVHRPRVGLASVEDLVRQGLAIPPNDQCRAGLAEYFGPAVDRPRLRILK